jgi:predicted amidohydrolase
MASLLLGCGHGCEPDRSRGDDVRPSTLGLPTVTATAESATAATPPDTVRIAAVQYAGQDASSVDGRCDEEDALCAITVLVRQAARGGAKLVVTPEYALGLDVPEVEPPVGFRPFEDPDRDRAGPAVVLSKLARELRIFLVAAMRTSAPGDDGDESVFNAQLAFGPDGRVVGRHHKVVLYAGERDELEAGADLGSFDTPFGTVGLLICADLYGDPRLHDRLTRERGARIITLSTMWTVERATRWQAAFARDWNVAVVGANGSTGAGRGGGIFGPDGRTLAIHESDEPGVIVADVPTR